MTTAEFRTETESGTIIMDVKGHAGFAEMGKDPVCAGASVLALTCAQVIEDMGASGALKKDPHTIIRNGRVFVAAKPKEESYHAVMLAYLFTETGFGLLSEVYPDSVQLTQFETAKTDSIKESSTSRTD